MTDELTGLLTGRDLTPSAFDGKTLALFVDIDGLIWLNDEHGHEAGDGAIVKVANAIARRAETVRVSSTYRIGGDEFLVVLPEFSLDCAIELASAIVEDVRGMRIEFTRRDQPSRTTLEVNAIAIQLTESAFVRYDGSCRLTDDFQTHLWEVIDAKRRVTGSHAGIVATCGGLGVSG